MCGNCSAKESTAGNSCLEREVDWRSVAKQGRKIQRGERREGERAREDYRGAGRFKTGVT